MYADATACPYPIYAEPSRKLYDGLGMIKTLEMGPKPEYLKSGVLTNALVSIKQALGTGSSMLKGGNMSQVGGDFLFEDGQAKWCHRMKNTRDHASMSELRKVIGLGDRSEEVKEAGKPA
jgi:hypothetical protein